MIDLNLKFEKAVRLLTQYAPISDKNTRKALLPHDIRVGVYLYERGYAEDIVIAGILHDALEFTNITEQMIIDQFGDSVLRLVKANTKNDSIKDKQEKTNELIKKCADCGKDALIIKTADIIDSFKYYSTVDNKGGIEYCVRNAKAILEFKPSGFTDKIFDELKKWQCKFQ